MSSNSVLITEHDEAGNLITTYIHSSATGEPWKRNQQHTFTTDKHVSRVDVIVFHLPTVQYTHRRDFH